MNLANQHPNASAAGASSALGVLIDYILAVSGVHLPVAASAAIPSALAVLALILPGPKRKKR